MRGRSWLVGSSVTLLLMPWLVSGCLLVRDAAPAASQLSLTPRLLTHHETTAKKSTPELLPFLPQIKPVKDEPQTEPYTKLPAKMTAEVGDFIEVVADTNGENVWWLVTDPALKMFPPGRLKDSKAIVLIAKRDGTYSVYAWTAVGGKSHAAAVCVITVGTPIPPPPPPPDPAKVVAVPQVVGRDRTTATQMLLAVGLLFADGDGDRLRPVVQQVPPAGLTVPLGTRVTLTYDVAPVDPAPIPVAGLRVLIVYESAEATKLPAAQQSSLYSQGMRDEFNAKCVVGPDGKTKEWRIYDKDVAMGGESKLWQDAMKRSRASVPWVVVSNGVAGFEGPLPGTVADMKALLAKYAK